MTARDGSTGASRRNFLRRASAALLLSEGSRRVARAGLDTPAALPVVEERIRKSGEDAPLSLTFQGTSADDCRAWQEQFSKRLRALLGPHRPPEKWMSTLERTVTFDDHIREERVLTVRGVDPVPLHLLLPPAAGKGHNLPAIVAVHGHGPYGHDAVAGVADTPQRRADIQATHYDYGLQLVRRGYVVAVPCLTPFGRRLTKPGQPPRKGDACGSTFIAMQLLGRLLMGENLRDILWAFEVLAAHEAVNPEKIGCVGLSYGGRMTMLTAAVEPRIKIAVISGALNCLQERVSTGHSAGCQVIPNLLAYGDVPEIGSLIAPRPCLWEVGDRDALMVPDWVETALTRMGRAYGAFHAKDKLRVDRFDGGHQWHGDVAYPFLDEVLRS